MQQQKVKIQVATRRIFLLNSSQYKWLSRTNMSIMASLRQKRVIRGKKINVTYSPSENDKIIQTKGIKILIMRFIIVNLFKSGCIFQYPFCNPKYTY